MENLENAKQIARDLCEKLKSRINTHSAINEVLLPICNNSEKLDKIKSVGEINIAILLLEYFIENGNLDINFEIKDESVLHQFNNTKSALMNILFNNE
jgi:hypothetical protein